MYWGPLLPPHVFYRCRCMCHRNCGLCNLDNPTKTRVCKSLWSSRLGYLLHDPSLLYVVYVTPKCQYFFGISSWCIVCIPTGSVILFHHTSEGRSPIPLMGNLFHWFVTCFYSFRLKLCLLVHIHHWDKIKHVVFCRKDCYALFAISGIYGGKLYNLNIKITNSHSLKLLIIRCCNFRTEKA